MMQRVFKNTLLIIGAIILLPCTMLAKDAPQYAIDKIPQELLKNANAVVRHNEVNYQIISEGKAHKEIKYAITILKENAIEEALFVETYDKFIKINDIEGIIYDANGKRVKRIKNDDILDYSAIQGFSIYEDNRIKAIDPEYMTLPFTIEYTFSTDYKSLFFMPSWYVFPGYNIAVESSSFKVSAPLDYNFRYQERNIDDKVKIQESDGVKIYTWQLQNFEAVNYEPLSPPATINYPCVYAEPSKFEIDNYHGDFTSWNDFGKFIATLNNEKDAVPLETQNEILELIKDASSDYEKIERIYKYSQKKNRYISVQVGIGGYQPFPAEMVDRLSYGDCKALSNYIRSLLKVAGIESNYTLVGAGTKKRPIDPLFPCNNFNHAFLCVPLENDTVWLECTSDISPCGYIGDFTDDRNVLLIEDEGGKLVKTPAYSAEENRQTTTGTVKITGNNAISVDAQLVYSGATYGDESYLLHRDETDRRKKIINSISIPNFKLTDYQLEDNANRKPSFTKKVQLEATNYCTSMGKRTMLKLNVFNIFNSVPRYARNRKNPVYVQRNYSECDTITFEVPTELTIEALPKETTLDTKYGKYQSHAIAKEGQITYYRYFEINKGTYPKEEFNDFREFLENVSIADNAKTVLISET